MNIVFNCIHVHEFFVFYFDVCLLPQKQRGGCLIMMPPARIDSWKLARNYEYLVTGLAYLQLEQQLWNYTGG